jgi:tetratricopeptide (TPR) repeat protein
MRRSIQGRKTMLEDARGVPLTASDRQALQAYESALEALRGYRGDPLAPLDEAIAIEPGFAGAYVAKALMYMTMFERRFAREALAALEAGARAIQAGNAHERAMANAARLLAEGEWEAASAALDHVLLEQPRDILAIQVGHLVDFLRGDNMNLRNRISRVLPRWDSSAPGFSYVLGMHAFGLEECNQYPEAEATGMRALAMAPEDGWAVHAVVHVMEMQGRVGEGIGFLQSRERDWASADNGFAFHNWWHLALFNMDRGDFAAAIAIYDRVLADAHAMALSRVDATALLWRLMLEGADLGARMEKVADAWEGDLEAEGGFYAFNDFHAALAFAATGRTAAITALRAKLQSALQAPGANREMTRAVGVDTVEAAIAFGEGRCAEATARLAAVRDGAWRFGGSHAQRDLLTLTLIEAARRSDHAGIARHYLNERLTHKPASAWGRRIAKRLEKTVVPA